MADRAKEMASAGAMGQEIPGDDLSADFDPLTHPSSKLSLEELEQLIDSESSSEGKQSQMTLEDFEDERMARYGREDEGPDEPENSEVQEGVDTREASEETEEEEEPEPHQEAATEKTQETEEEEPVAVKAEPVESDEIGSLKRQMEILRLEGDKNAAELEKRSLLADREAGQKGSLLQQVKELQSRLSQGPREEYEETGAEAQYSTPSVPSELTEELQEIRAERVARAIQSEGVAFYGDSKVTAFLEGLKSDPVGFAGVKGDEAVKAFHEDFQSRVQTSSQEVREAMHGTNPKVSATLTRTILRSAWADARIAHLQAREEAGAALKAEGKTRLTEKKKSAGATRSVRGGAPKAKQKRLDPTTASLEDLERQINADFGVDEGAGQEFI